MKFENALMAVRDGATAYHHHGAFAYWLTWDAEQMRPVVLSGEECRALPCLIDIEADWTVIGAKVEPVAAGPDAEDDNSQYVSKVVGTKIEEWNELSDRLNGLGVPCHDGDAGLQTLLQRVEWYLNAVRKYDASGVAPSMPHLSDIEHPLQHAYPDEPEFKSSDADLNELLNAVADYVQNKNHNMDTGLHMVELLERVQQRLAGREIHQLVASAKRLSFAAQITGGTAGRDEGLVSAIDELEGVLAGFDVSTQAGSVATDSLPNYSF